jgi:hypothetical protein
VVDHGKELAELPDVHGCPLPAPSAPCRALTPAANDSEGLSISLQTSLGR